MLSRIATASDIDQLVDLRQRQLIDEGQTAEELIETELHHFFAKHFGNETLVQWVIEEQDQIIATAGVLFYEFPPSFMNKSGLRAYVTNVFTDPAYRGQGFAPALLNRLVVEAKRRNVRKLFLESSTIGKPVYQKYGFIENDSWMELWVDALD